MHFVVLCGLQWMMSVCERQIVTEISMMFICCTDLVHTCIINLYTWILHILLYSIMVVVILFIFWGWGATEWAWGGVGSGHRSNNTCMARYMAFGGRILTSTHLAIGVPGWGWKYLTCAQNTKESEADKCSLKGSWKYPTCWSSQEMSYLRFGGGRWKWGNTAMSSEWNSSFVIK